MEKIQILKDKNCDIKVTEVANLVNSTVKNIKIEVIDSNYDFNERLITHPDTLKKHYSLIRNKIKSDTVILLTDVPYDDNFFFYSNNELIIISFYGWEHLTQLPKENGLLYWLCILAMRDLFTTQIRHLDNTGCANDFLGDKTGIDLGMRQANLCPDCLKKLPKLTTEKKKTLKDTQSLLDLLSQSSRWNQNILLKQLPATQTLQVKKKKPLVKGQINLLIASPSDTTREREILRNHLERRFRTDSYEASLQTRAIVHGWEDLASQSGYPQDIINDLILPKVDVVIGILKHKLGTPTKNKAGKKRAESGTVEELYFALEKNPNTVLCMLYSYSIPPSPSLDDPNIKEIQANWAALKKFKSQIKDKIIYKSYSSEEELLEMVIKDLAKNVERHFK